MFGILHVRFSYTSDQDSVRLLAVEGCAALGKLLEPQNCIAHILPVIVNFSQVLMKFVNPTKVTIYFMICCVLSILLALSWYFVVVWSRPINA